MNNRNYFFFLPFYIDKDKIELYIVKSVLGGNDDG